MSDENIKAKRPLSPHLQVYKLPFSAYMSILHRATGAFLSIFGVLLLLAFCYTLMCGAECYDAFVGLLGTLIGRLFLFALSVCAFYHMFNGFRHLFWDSGKLFKIDNAQNAGAFVMLATAAAVLGYWYCAYYYVLMK
ncbi:MAG: succinate dehydrogenase, cytochrome b556 subunit [Pseudomonadota bacterium]|nr:succinate dehydrogenase, cytochrome b556 subunit [Alphaproteobacteria bacterium]MEC7576218.1 succinate dehydrogenase, cytochrome b556 subunit [Pseudomonadota bacterium]MCS5595924.1 succinate dehydrogenase, cytochrome b556 subunit [Alphaproteobacteria bacterium]MEC7702091.1 succinate dehydrogenase, cytochrome b556 subunit [Pseudomonadota bacterium]MEC9235285.1 succinate dehydrogenase, cytochrome b556 subunit [Pseudomonadota bacterium]|tara:strand:+ start:4639 stop:5049 length:411 start_codon:yes stop_codon:yes gene_type:complete